MQEDKKRKKNPDRNPIPNPIPKTNPNPNPDPNLIPHSKPNHKRLFSQLHHLRFAICVAPFALRRIQKARDKNTKKNKKNKGRTNDVTNWVLAPPTPLIRS